MVNCNLEALERAAEATVTIVARMNTSVPKWSGSSAR